MESQQIIWFACYHEDSESHEMKRTTLGDVKDCADNLVERKITQDASGNRSVRRTFFFFALEGLFSLSLSLSRSIDSLYIHTQTNTGIAPLEKNGLEVTANETKIALFRFGVDTIYAINRRCPHKGGPLHLGDIEDLGKERKRLCVVCPWHKWTFSLETGKLIVPNIETTEATVYPVKLISKSQRVQAESPDIENLRKRFREADAEFKRATLISSPHTIEIADARRRQATAELQRYLQHNVRTPRGSVVEEDEIFDRKEEEEEEEEEENTSWIFRRSFDFSVKEIGPISKETAQRRRRSRGFSLLSEDSEMNLNGDLDGDLEIFVGFPSFDDSVFNSTDF